MQKNFTIGMAGHIDHGKTALTKALTGTFTDRLKEEQEREISIEPGFASLYEDDELAVSIIDVPGHERFIRQMIAGVAGIEDRKSTRLNSSHVAVSYAFFCLKK